MNFMLVEDYGRKNVYYQVLASNRYSDFSNNQDVGERVLLAKEGFVAVDKKKNTLLGFLLLSPAGIHTIFVLARGRSVMSEMLRWYSRNYYDGIFIWDIQGDYNKHMINWYNTALHALDIQITI